MSPLLRTIVHRMARNRFPVCPTLQLHLERDVARAYSTNVHTACYVPMNVSVVMTERLPCTTHEMAHAQPACVTHVRMWCVCRQRLSPAYICHERLVERYEHIAFASQFTIYALLRMFRCAKFESLSNTMIQRTNSEQTLSAHVVRTKPSWSNKLPFLLQKIYMDFFSSLRASIHFNIQSWEKKMNFCLRFAKTVFTVSEYIYWLPQQYTWGWYVASWIPLCLCVFGNNSRSPHNVLADCLIIQIARWRGIHYGKFYLGISNMRD